MNKINMNDLIRSASEKLGVEPEKLKSALNTGDISAVTQRLSPSDRAKIDAVMKNPALSESIRRKYMGDQ